MAIYNLLAQFGGTALGSASGILGITTAMTFSPVVMAIDAVQKRVFGDWMSPQMRNAVALTLPAMAVSYVFTVGVITSIGISSPLFVESALVSSVVIPALFGKFFYEISREGIIRNI